MNAVLQAMKERRSVRAYQDKPVPRDAIERICEAVRISYQVHHAYRP